MTKNEKVKSAPEKKVVVCISGMAGTGKSTEEGYDSSSRGWWESPEGLSFLEKREKNLKFDKAVDDKLLKYAQQGRVLLDSWTMPWLLRTGFKIWLVASVEKRAERIAKRDRIPIKEALMVLKEKEAKTKAIYKKLYGFTLGEDFEPFNLVLDTDALNAREVFQVLCTVMDNVILESEAQ